MEREEVSATGVLEHCLSKEVIQEYKTGIEAKVSVDKAVQIGQKTYTATVTQRQLSLESQLLQPRDPGLLSGANIRVTSCGYKHKSTLTGFMLSFARLAV